MKFKRFVSAVMAAAVLGAAVPVIGVDSCDFGVCASEEAAEYTEITEGLFTYHQYADYTELYECSSDAEGTIEIPDAVNGLPVVISASNPFGNCANITAFTVNENNKSYTTVNGVLFTNDMKTLMCYPRGKEDLIYQVPESVVEISDFAFFSNSFITEVILPDGLKSIGYESLDQCSSLTKINIPESVEYIGFRAFYSSPVKGESDEGLIYLDNWVIGEEIIDYENDKILIYNVNVKEGTVGIASGVMEGAFMGYTAKESFSVTLPSSLKYCLAMPYIYGFAVENFAYTLTVLNPDCYIEKDGAATIIRGYENSTAQIYAEENDIEFVSLGEAPAASSLGDIDGDSAVNSSDASRVLTEYALIATGAASTLTEAQFTAADVNKDKAVDSSDASTILSYYAYTATGGTDSFEDYLA